MMVLDVKSLKSLIETHEVMRDASYKDLLSVEDYKKLAKEISLYDDLPLPAAIYEGAKDFFKENYPDLLSHMAYEDKFYEAVDKHAKEV